MKSLSLLKSEAENSCEFRGHNMEWNRPAHYSQWGLQHIVWSNTSTVKSKQRAECVECGMEVFLTTKPEPNGIDIGGEAVALNCPTS